MANQLFNETGGIRWGYNAPASNRFPSTIMKSSSNVPLLKPSCPSWPWCRPATFKLFRKLQSRYCYTTAVKKYFTTTEKHKKTGHRPFEWKDETFSFKENDVPDGDTNVRRPYLPLSTAPFLPAVLACGFVALTPVASRHPLSALVSPAAMSTKHTWNNLLLYQRCQIL